MKPSEAKLLVVDDSESMRHAICDVLSDLGFPEIDEAANGELALALFHQKQYDVVVTDWNMPFLNGIELLKAIRRADHGNDTPVLLLTGQATVSRVSEAIEAGANGFVKKPFVSPSLQEKVLALILVRPVVMAHAPSAQRLRIGAPNVSPGLTRGDSV